MGSSPGEYAEHYNVLNGLGMVNPYVRDGGACTFCTDNGLSSSDSDDDNRVIDHIFVKGHTTATASRVLDEGITTESCGEPLDGNLSDHYGVQIDVVRE